MFRDVDVALPVESDVEDEAIPVPHIVRAAQRKPLEDLSREISARAHGPVPYATGRRWLGLWLMLPAWLRRRIIRLVLPRGQPLYAAKVSQPAAWGIHAGGRQSTRHLSAAGSRAERQAVGSAALRARIAAYR